MNKIFFTFVFYLLLITSNGIAQLNNTQVFKAFHTLYKQSNIKGLYNLLSDSIIIVDENNGTRFSKSMYLHYIEHWSMVMPTVWHIDKVVKKGDTTITIEYDTDIYKNYTTGMQKNKFTYIAHQGRLVYLGWKIHTQPTYNIEEEKRRTEKFMEWATQQNSSNSNLFLMYDKRNTLAIKNLLIAFLKQKK